MQNKFLQAAYATESFRARGHQLIDQLADHLETQLQDPNAKAIDWHTPEEEHEFWKKYLAEGPEADLFPQILKRIVNVHNPKYIGHQVTPTAPITALTAMISGLLNNGMAVYEMGMAPSAMERVVTDVLCEKLGYTKDSRGFLTSGGTLATLTALLAARKAKLKTNVWLDGIKKSYAIMVSEQAHYCVDRSAKIMGLGEKGIIKIPVTDNFQMDTSVLSKEYKKAIDQGIEIFAIVGSAPSTATGVYDDLEAVGAFAQKHNLWFHVDGAHGGAAIFSDKYKHLVKGISNADSVVIDGHKMMMMPTITTALLFKNGNDSHATFSQKADYLLDHSENEDWYNLAKRTFECTKTMMSMHWYTMLKTYGEGIFNEYVTNAYNLGRQFGSIITNTSNFELAVPPVSNIVCFRYIHTSLDLNATNTLNEKIRQLLLEDGEFYIVQTKLRGVHYLRCTVMNAFTSDEHFKNLLNKIEQFAKPLM